MFTIDPSDPTPIYAQLERSIRVAIGSGRLRAGERLPTVRQLAVALRVNANTVAKVYGELERAGVLETCRGVGTFVLGLGGPAGAAARPDHRRELLRLADRFLGDAAALGVSAEDAIALLQARWLELRSNRENVDG
jgi:GntR family transcriptional regulator